MAPKTSNLLVILLIIVLCGTLNAQQDFREGYIINNSLDTLHGFLDYGNPKQNSKYCLFKSEKDANVERFLPEDIVAYRFNDSKLYMAKEVEILGSKRFYFLEYLVDGMVDLYLLSITHADFFFLEREGELFELSNEKETIITDSGREKRYVNPYSATLKFVMRDAPTLFDEIDQTEFKFRDFIEITKSYHEVTCTTGEDCIDFTKKEKKLHDVGWKLRVGGAIRSNRVQQNFEYQLAQTSVYYYRTIDRVVPIEFSSSNFFDSFRDQIETSKWTITPALVLNLTNKWNTALQVEFQYQKLTNTYRDKEMTLKFLEGTIAVNKEFFYYKRTRPYIKLGISLNKYSSYEVSDVQLQYGIPDVVDGGELFYRPVQSNVDNLLSNEQGISVGSVFSIGVSHTLEKGHKFFAEVGMDRHLKKINAPFDFDFRGIYRSRVSSTYFSVGVLF